MWWKPRGFCIKERRSYMETSCILGDVEWRWPWLLIRLGFFNFYIGWKGFPYFWCCHCTREVLQYLVCVGSIHLFPYASFYLVQDNSLDGILLKNTNYHIEDWMILLIKILINCREFCGINSRTMNVACFAIFNSHFDIVQCASSLL